jgi:hypothetical protein
MDSTFFKKETGKYGQFKNNKKGCLITTALALQDYNMINYSTTTIPFAVTRISFSGLVIAAISSFDFLASSA